jgi:cell division protease FtsH
MSKMHVMANALLEWETIDAEQIQDIIEGRPPRPPKPTGSGTAAPGGPGGPTGVAPTAPAAA